MKLVGYCFLIIFIFFGPDRALPTGFNTAFLNAGLCSSQTTSNCSLSQTVGGRSGGSCEYGYSGTCGYTCFPNGIWNLNSNSCTITQCGSTTVSNCYLATSANHNVYRTGSCVSGYTGDCVYQCLNGSWSQDTNTCVPICTTGGSLRTCTNPGEDPFVIPAGVTAITVKAWGAGGGGANASAIGGGGGFAQATLAVTAGETLYIGVASGGGQKGGGGGMSYVRRGSTYLIVAGGGGGAGVDGNSGSQGATGNAAGGAGGGTTGVSGNNASYGADAGNGGGGGTSSSGGAAGTMVSGTGTPGLAGAFETGGDAGGTTGGNGNHGGYKWQGGVATYGNGAGGGGGAGYYGGGGGAGRATYWGAGGGGGSSMVTGTSTNIIAGSGSTPGGNADPNYISGVGTGGTSNTAGGKGRVYITW